MEDLCDLGKDLEVLDPEGCFTQAHTPGCFGWFPAPAAADATIDHFCEAVHKQTSYIAPLGVTVFNFRIFWGSEPLGHVRPTFIKFDQYRPTLILFMDWVTISD
jgi:hypothetical protein